MKKKLTLLILLLIVFSLNAQLNKTVTGKVVDGNNKPIADVSVLVKNTDNGTATSIDGKYTLQIPKGQQTLIFSAIGFKTIKKNIVTKESNITLNIILEENTTKLSEVTIEGETKKSHINKLNIRTLEIPLSISTVSAEVLELRNITKIEEALKNITGASATSRYGGFTSFSIRGFSFSDHALLVDGIRDERISMSWAPITNLANVEKIEVLKGPESVLSGHSVLGGTISITRKQPSKKQKVTTKFDYGSYNSFTSIIGIGGAINNKLKYRFDFGSTKSDGWRNNKQNTNNGSLLLDFTPDNKNFLQLSVQGNNDFYATETGLPTKHDKFGDVELLDGINIETRYNDPEDALKHKRLDFSLKYIHTFSEKAKINNTLSYSDDDIYYVSNDGMLTVNPEKTKIKRETLIFNHHAKPLINQLDFTYKYKINNVEQKILLGNYFSSLDRRTHRFNSEGPGVTAELDLFNPIVNQGYRKFTKSKTQIKKEQVASFYIQNWMNFSQKLKLLLGIRFDNFYSNYTTDIYNDNGYVTSTTTEGKDDFNIFTYRTGLVYTPTRHSSIFASYSTYFKPSRKFDANNNVFDPEEGFQTELGIKYQPGYKFQGSIAAFYILKDNILEKSTNDSYKKLGQAQSKGFEIDINYNPSEKLYVKAGYAYIDASVKKSTLKDPITQESVVGNQLRYSTNHLFNLWVNYQIFGDYENHLKLGVGVNYTGKSATYSSSAHKIPDYTLVDTSLHYTLKNIRLGVNINNLFNEFYFSSSISNWGAYPPRVMATPGIKRNYTISIAYHL